MSAIAVITECGQALRFLRESAGLSLGQVARCAGVSPAYLRDVEAGTKGATPIWLGTVSEAIVRLGY